MTTYSHLGVDFTVDESRFGLFTSYDKDGAAMTTALTENACVQVTKDIRIPVLQGTFDGYTSIGRSATVDGKL